MHTQTADAATVDQPLSGGRFGNDDGQGGILALNHRTAPESGLIWIAGYPKSGNTFVRLFFEAWFSGRTPQVDVPLRYSLTHRLPKIWWDLMPVPQWQLSRVQAAQLWPVFYAHVLAKCPHVELGGRPRVLMKTHSLLATQSGVPLIPPALSDRAIYVIRDPRDGVLSYEMHLDVSLDFAVEVFDHERSRLGLEPGDRDPLAELIGSWSANVDSWTVPPLPFPVHVMRFEDMVGEPEASFAAMLGFLGEGVDRARIARTLELIRFEALQVAETRGGCAWAPTGRFFNHGRSHWRQDLDPQTAGAIADRHGAVMQEWGYV